jgi:hypothetical protein
MVFLHSIKALRIIFALENFWIYSYELTLLRSYAATNPSTCDKSLTENFLTPLPPYFKKLREIVQQRSKLQFEGLMSKIIIKHIIYCKHLSHPKFLTPMFFEMKASKSGVVSKQVQIS